MTNKIKIINAPSLEILESRINDFYDSLHDMGVFVKVNKCDVKSHEWIEEIGREPKVIGNIFYATIIYSLGGLNNEK